MYKPTHTESVTFRLCDESEYAGMFIAQCFHHLLTYHQTLIYTSRHEIRYMDTLSSFSATLRKGNNFCHCLFVFREGEVLQKRSKG